MSLGDFKVEAGVAVSDLERAREFYEGRLGLEPDEEEPELVRYRCGGGTRIFVYLAPDNAGKTTATVAGWFVDDLDALMAELGTAGVGFEHYDQPGLKTDDRGVFEAGPFRAAWFTDPDGNTFAITQRD